MSTPPVLSAASSLIADLAHPDRYPEPRPQSVSVCTTHISWVFLADDVVYKVKRPVDLGFVDFATAPAREYFCHEEVRLNAALAPGIYQAVVPIWHSTRGFSFLGPGTIVDHAVKMRRLPHDRSAAALLVAGQLTPAHLARLAERLAQHYENAPLTPDFADVRVMSKNVEENLTQLATWTSDPLDEVRLREIAAAQRRDLQWLQSALHDRLAAGKIRAGHGDLRLEHVYFPSDEGPPLVIDCVEFAERFRAGDVALDVAFLVMELEAAGASTHAAYFLSRFARATGDFALYPLTDFYLCYRALVRTKIACLLAHDPSTPPDKARGKRAEAVRLLALAHAHATGRPQPRVVIVVGGLMGAGKSTVAEALSRRLGLAVVASDVARKQLAGLHPTERGDASLYDPAVTQRTYDEVMRRAAFVLDSGRGVVLDATFRSPADRARARALADAHDATFLFVQVICDEATLRQRLRARVHGARESDADEAIFERTATSFVAPTELSSTSLLSVRSDDAEDDLIATVLAKLPR